MDQVWYDLSTAEVKNPFVLIDLSDVRTCSDEQQLSLRSLLHYCGHDFIAIMAHSSGSASFLPYKSVAARSLRNYQNGPTVLYVPFSNKEADDFFSVHPETVNVKY